MHTNTLRKLALALTLWMALYASSLKAQIFTAPLQASTTGTNPVDFEFRADGTMIAKGNFGIGSLLSGDEGTGTRMLWFPSLGALRAGSVANGTYSGYIGSTQWDQDNIGAYSQAFGISTTASGYCSTASGYFTIASGLMSFVHGATAQATGDFSTAWGFATASGYLSTAWGGSSIASGNNCTAWGTDALATGSSATAFGISTVATGSYAVATGGNSTASGYYSSASGYYSQAQSMASFAVGAYNVGGGSTNTWVPTDPIFEIGNGVRYGERSDAMVVYKNGNAKLQGSLDVAPGGDISMGSFTAGTAP